MAHIKKVRGAGHGRDTTGHRRRTTAGRRTRANAAVSQREKTDRFWRERYAVAAEPSTVKEKEEPAAKASRGTREKQPEG